MNILVIGNGFDLAHGLPTKYTDFLEFCKRVMATYNDSLTMDNSSFKHQFLDGWKIDEKIKEDLEYMQICFAKNESDFAKNFPHFCEFCKCIKKNLWIKYFLNNQMYQKENWIDFESEISDVIKSLDNDMKKNDDTLEDAIYKCSNFFLNNEICSNLDDLKSIPYTYRKIRDKLLDDLNKLTRALEIYLSEYIEKIDIQKKSPDIEKLEVDFILSFNYTHIFPKLYEVSEMAKSGKVDSFDYIHGEVNIDNTIESNKMVLGIDEYLSKKRRNKEVEFIAFKKYYQRIHKQTGSKYQDWMDRIRKEHSNKIENINNLKSKIDKYEDKREFSEKRQRAKELLKELTSNSLMHNLYIFGHSLDVTDKDVLRHLILNDNVYTTIFYLNKDVMGQQIANLVKVIGQDELIKRTGGSTKTIEFKQQQDMVEI